MDKFPEQLRRLRKAANLSQEALARKATLTLNTVHHLEKGVASPTLASVVRIAKALRVSLDELVGFELEAAVTA